MSRGPLTFKQRDVTRAIKAAKAAGIEACVKIDKAGNIVIIPAKGELTNGATAWDDAIAELSSQ
jgi:hypothetical protein